MAWATPDQVKKITNTELDDVETDEEGVKTSGHLNVAVGIIELKTGLIQDAIPNVAGRDGLFLMRAVAYQSLFVQDRPDLFTTLDVASTSQDGQSASFKADALYLAPLAKMALRRLSWKGTHSTTAGTPSSPVEDDDLDANGRPLAWRAL